MAHKIGVIGDKYSVMPFKLFGFDVCYGMSARQIRDSIEQMAAEDYGVIFITEEASEQVSETINRYRSRIQPAIILIPSNAGSKGIGKKAVQKNVEKAIGQNIL
ncbi:V-type ATP synthase subunit F [Enterococcus sp. BWT-B8]|uniref:V-type ATP synthase subunit F n=1 Tax=Enterococcus sp. BWT-B8 TaxID=2885157 RepID=UPI001E33F369|nr:V-type ATP synthase subunit F [Enterococcus sp. BWT-B8]MCB5950798.1 V-type ATP synthase subunit F [Enterococcus sp. BWT-B8]